MAEIARICKEAAKQEPERHFASPAAIVEEIMLTRGEKLATLEAAASQHPASTGCHERGHAFAWLFERVRSPVAGY